MPKGIEKAFELDPKVWAKINAAAITMIKVRTDKGRDRRGRKFRAYDKKYAAQKGRGFTRKDGTRYRQFTGKSLSRQVDPPNFRLTGETMNTLRVLRVTKRKGAIGWTGQPAVRVSAHERRGKYKIGGVTKKELKKLGKIFADEYDKRWNRFVKSQTVTVRI
jgi:hypothetical protein